MFGLSAAKFFFIYLNGLHCCWSVYVLIYAYKSWVCVLECSKRSRSSRNKNLMMAVQVGNREINFMRSYDDVVGNLTDTHMTG